MKTSDLLVNACRTNVLPDTCVLSDYGLDSKNSINIYGCYKDAIVKDGIDSDQLHKALENNKLNDLVMNSPSNILKQIKIKTIWDDGKDIPVECKDCNFINRDEKIVCVCCSKPLSRITKGFS